MKNQLAIATEYSIKKNSPSPEAIKLLKAFLMRTSVPRIVTQRINEKSEKACKGD